MKGEKWLFIRGITGCGLWRWEDLMKRDEYAERQQVRNVCLNFQTERLKKVSMIAQTNICRVKPFIVPFKYGWKTYRLKVEQISLNERKEQFRIGTLRKHMIIETNRPLFRLRGLKHRKPKIIQLTTGTYQERLLLMLMSK